MVLAERGQHGVPECQSGLGKIAGDEINIGSVKIVSLQPLSCQEQSGAAAKLRIPPSTLETRIKALRINKQQFKFG